MYVLSFHSINFKINILILYYIMELLCMLSFCGRGNFRICFSVFLVIVARNLVMQLKKVKIVFKLTVLL